MRGVGIGAAGLALGRFGIEAFAAEGSKPNIIVIVADDLGYADLGIQGCKDVPTPNIDSIGKGGVRFTNGYVSCPVCSPTRAGLMTGRYQQRFGHEFNPGPSAAPNFGLPLDEVTIADRLKTCGYRTGLVGKWHLGNKPEFHPMKRGFDEFYGFLPGAHQYQNLTKTMPSPILRGTEAIDEKEYLTDAFGREAAAYIDRNHDKPFLLMLTFNAVHTPQQVPEKYLKRFESIKDAKRKNMAAMLSAMDDNVGRVLERLREHKIEDNTLIFFHSDNGGPTAGNGSLNTPLQGFKGNVLEGGIRIPYLVKWPGHIPAGKVVDNPVIQLDIHATALAAAGYTGSIAAAKKLDGVDLVPFLDGKATGKPHEVLYWRFGDSHAVRKGNYKLLHNPQGDRLFDLAADIGETKDISKDKPEVFEELKKLYAEWDKQLVAPKWERQAKPKKKKRPAARKRRQAK